MNDIKVVDLGQHQFIDVCFSLLYIIIYLGFGQDIGQNKHSEDVLLGFGMDTFNFSLTFNDYWKSQKWQECCLRKQPSKCTNSLKVTDHFPSCMDIPARPHRGKNSKKVSEGKLDIDSVHGAGPYLHNTQLWISMSIKWLFDNRQDGQVSCVTFCLDVGLTRPYKSSVSSRNALAATSLVLLCLCFSATCSVSCT